jgi:hypothetical protein
VNIRRIRYAHVLLTAAEAAARTGQDGNAQTWLNQVRARARSGNGITLGGLYPEVLASSIADVLGLAAGTSRVFVRYADPDDAAYAAGARSFEDECIGSCPSGETPPVRVISMDVIQSVGGVPVTTLAQYQAEVNSKAPGQQVAVGVLRVSQSDGTTSTQSLNFNVTAQALLPDVTASGDQLLEAIWTERRHELAMEQHRWFDLRRQGPERAQAAMALAGKDFQARHMLYPIPAGEVSIAGLQQNPGY